MIREFDATKLPYDPLIRALCATPYYGHSKGCPNRGYKEGCPPLPLIDNIYDLEKEFYVIYTSFSVGDFAQRMKERFPDWKSSSYPDHPKKTQAFTSKIRTMLRERHPDWPEEYFPPEQVDEWESARNWYNPRRWQGRARKFHNKEIDRFKKLYPHMTVDKCPEARGINITALMYELGVNLDWQWPPQHNTENKVYHRTRGEEAGSSASRSHSWAV